MKYIYVAESPYEGLIGASESLKKCYDELAAACSHIRSYSTYRKGIKEDGAYYTYDGSGEGWGIRKTHIL